MSEILGRTIEFVTKISPRVAASVFLFCVVILLLPVRVIAWLDLASVMRTYRTALSLALLGTGTYLATYVLHSLWKHSIGYIQHKRALVRGKDRMRHLSFDEKKVLQSYLKHRALTRRWNLGSGVVNGLVADGILFRASQVGSKIEGFAYNVHRWAYEYLSQHPDLVATPGDSSEPDAFF